MKRIISTLLTIAMLLSLVPAVFAEDVTEGEAASAGVKIVYDIHSILAGGNSLGKAASWASNNVPASDFSYEATKGYLQYVTNSSGQDVIDVSTIKWNQDGLFLCSSSWWAFKVYVPADGVYTPQVEYGSMGSKGNTLHVSLVKADSVLNSTVISNNKLTIDGKNTGIVHSATASQIWYETPQSYDAKTLEKGEYYVVYSTGSGANWAMVKNFILDGTADANTASKLMRPIVTADTDKIAVGGSGASLSAVVYDTENNQVADAVYTYASSDENIATVDANGKVTGVGMGTATITVTATKDGYSSFATIDIDVMEDGAAGIDLTYKFTGSTHAITWKETSPGFAKLTYDVGKDLNQYYANNKNALGHDESDAQFRGYGHEGFGMGAAVKGNWYAATIRVPVSGKYAASVEIAKYYSGASTLGVYLVEKEAELTTEELEAKLTGDTLIGSVNLTDSRYKTLMWLDKPENLGVVDLDAGEYYLVFKNTAGSAYTWFGDFLLNGYGNGTAPIITECKAEKTEFEIDDTANITTAVRYITDGNSAENVTYTYESSDKDVAEVSADGTITAKSAGDATITVTATATNATLPGTRTIDVTVNASTIIPEEEEITDTKVNFRASAYEGGSVSNANVQEVEIGSDVTVTATADEGYTFAYWKNSAGVVLSTKETETFKVNTNTGVIAVFDKDVAEGENIPVYFYNGNGVSLGNASVAKNSTFEAAKTAADVPAIPTLTGFVFSHWSDKDAEAAIDDSALITALTRAVAIYTDDATKTFTVKNGDTTVASGKKYGESVTVNGGDNFSCWKLGDKVISYEKDYTFNVYGDITLTEVTEGTMDTAPVLVLDKVDGNYFLIYDEGNYELIEAGILFGSENVSIASIDGYKAAAKKGTGQFTALPHEGATSSTIARGYMICKSGDEFKVIYAD